LKQTSIFEETEIDIQDLTLPFGVVVFNMLALGMMHDDKLLRIILCNTLG